MCDKGGRANTNICSTKTVTTVGMKEILLMEIFKANLLLFRGANKLIYNYSILMPRFYHHNLMHFEKNSHETE